MILLQHFLGKGSSPGASDCRGLILLPIRVDEHLPGRGCRVHARVLVLVHHLFFSVLSQQHTPHLPHQVISGGGEDPSLKLVSNVDSIMEECWVFLVDDPSRWIAAHAAVFPNDLWLCLGSKSNKQWGIEDQPLRWDRSTRKRLLDNKFDLESKMFSKEVFCLPAWWSSCRSGSRLCWLVTRGCFCGATAWYAHQIYEHFEVNGISKSNVISSATFSACSRCVWRESPERRRWKHHFKTLFHPHFLMWRACRMLA